MDSKTLSYLTAILVIVAGVLLAIRTVPLFLETSSDKYVSLNDVKGVAVSHEGKLYTLNFEQYKEMLTMLNKAILITKQTVSDKDPKANFDKIVIYKFTPPDVELKPVAMQGDAIILSAPAWSTDKYLKDTSNGALKKLIDHSFDTNKDTHK